MALHRAGKADSERLCRELQRADGDELSNESLFFALDHARRAITEWRQDFNSARPHSSLGSQTPAAFAGALAAIGSDLRRLLNPPYGVTKMTSAL